MTAELQTRVDAALWRAGRRPGLLVVSATDGDDSASASRGPLPDPPCAPERAVFEIGSITKVFTSLLLAIAAERGELGVDDPLVEHLPGGTRVPMRDGRPIRLIDLATHRSGLPRLPPGFLLHALRHRDDPYARLSMEDALAALGKTRPRAAGERFRYSNYGAGVLGIALAHAAATDYEALVRERITTPLGLRDTVITLSEDHRSRLAAGTKGWGGPAGLWAIPGLTGAGALRSTAADLLTFIRAQMGTLPNVPEELAAAIRSSHQARAAGGRLTPGMRVALGWLLVGIGRQKVQIVMHNGGTGGYRSFAGWAPDGRHGVVVLSANVRSVDGIASRLLLDLERPTDPA
ncbi:MAG TPA: serine hydrolase domain-containing protein [Actinomycetota bacterium]|nr:serine hydrolase domain-containing protein [Actinomycetota bacterium]